MKYLQHYPKHIISQIEALMAENKLDAYLLKKYPDTHKFGTDKSLYHYTLDIKNSFLKQSLPLSKVVYDGKINVIKNALGTHTYVSRVQGTKLKSKNELRVASLFKKVPEPFLRMIVVHELAHLKEKKHNKAFYKLCQYMEPQYHQFELDLRIYLTYIDKIGKLY